MSLSRPLLRPHLLTVAKAYSEARAELVAMNFEHQRELDALHEQIASRSFRRCPTKILQVVCRQTRQDRLVDLIFTRS
jgi:hypothetical protein